MVKKVRYQEEEIRDLRGNRFYLRSKWSVSEYVVVTIRTQRGGKGKAVARTRYLEGDFVEGSKALLRLCRKWRKFYRVFLHPCWTLSV